MVGLFQSLWRKMPQRTLSQAVEEAGERLRDVLKDKNIRVVLVDSVESPVLDDFKRQWDYSRAGKNDSRSKSKKSRFGWFAHANSVKYYPDTYMLALYSEDTLCGLCASSINENGSFFRRRNIEISTIEGNPSNHPLKGCLIAAFTQVSLSVAKTLKAGSVSVFDPVKETIPSYLMLGYKRVMGRVSLYKPVKDNTELDWSAVFDRRQSKSRQHALS